MKNNMNIKGTWRKLVIVGLVGVCGLTSAQALNAQPPWDRPVPQEQSVIRVKMPGKHKIRRVKMPEAGEVIRVPLPGKNEIQKVPLPDESQVTRVPLPALGQ